MKRFRKMMAIVIVAVMTMAFVVPMSFAAGDAKSDDTISVTDLTAGDVVKYYQVLQWNDSAGWGLTDGFKDLIKTDGAGLGTTEKAVVDAIIAGITQEQANTISALANTASPVITNGETLTGKTWSKSNPAPGLYMVIVAAKDAGVVYNPAFVAADYDGTNTTNTISITEKYSNTSVAKKEDVTVTKTTSDSDSAVDQAIDSFVGQEVTFYVDTEIPVFLDSYKNKSFDIVDEIDNDNNTKGVELVSGSIKVTVGTGNSAVTYTGTTADVLTITENSKIGYTVSFDAKYLDTVNVAKRVHIEYKGKITNLATFNVNEDNNTVTVTYSNGPKDEKAAVRDRTNHYTFSIGADMFSAEGKTGGTYELMKVAVSEDGTPVVSASEVLLWRTPGNRHPLAGATFSLYRDAGCQTAYTNDIYPNGATSTTGPDGKITFKGLAAGTYYMKETDAPDGYIMDDRVTEIVITATYDEVEVGDTTDSNGIKVKGYTTKVLDSYTVSVNGVSAYDSANNKYGEITSSVVNVYQYTHEGPTISEVITSTWVEGNKVNTKGIQLPSTGGMGTTLFYIIGAILIIGAGVLLVTRRRVDNQQ